MRLAGRSHLLAQFAGDRKTETLDDLSLCSNIKKANWHAHQRFLRGNSAIHRRGKSDAVSEWISTTDLLWLGQTNVVSDIIITATMQSKWDALNGSRDLDPVDVGYGYVLDVGIIGT
ncbi:unnamed protein product [Cylicostephanus goldi]|uniref:Uncharacterized protein n=1 Tax=Cylicostephanus goldi TaxID=71465 RepID=A0A3P7M8Z4_CYLGO|nr:unnamed protein product [Cylicostephanus goldi]